jgi:hypothetical protein
MISANSPTSSGMGESHGFPSLSDSFASNGVRLGEMHTTITPETCPMVGDSIEPNNLALYPLANEVTYPRVTFTRAARIDSNTMFGFAAEARGSNSFLIAAAMEKSEDGNLAPHATAELMLPIGAQEIIDAKKAEYEALVANNALNALEAEVGDRSRAMNEIADRRMTTGKVVLGVWGLLESYSMGQLILMSDRTERLLNQIDLLTKLAPITLAGLITSSAVAIASGVIQRNKAEKQFNASQSNIAACRNILMERSQAAGEQPSAPYHTVKFDSESW